MFQDILFLASYRVARFFGGLYTVPSPIQGRAHDRVEGSGTRLSHSMLCCFDTFAVKSTSRYRDLMVYSINLLCSGLAAPIN